MQFNGSVTFKGSGFADGRRRFRYFDVGFWTDSGSITVPCARGCTMGTGLSGKGLVWNGRSYLLVLGSSSAVKPSRRHPVFVYEDCNISMGCHIKTSCRWGSG